MAPTPSQPLYPIQFMNELTKCFFCYGHVINCVRPVCRCTIVACEDCARKWFTTPIEEPIWNTTDRQYGRGNPKTREVPNRKASCPHCHQDLYSTYVLPNLLVPKALYGEVNPFAPESLSDSDIDDKIYNNMFELCWQRDKTIERMMNQPIRCPDETCNDFAPGSWANFFVFMVHLYYTGHFIAKKDEEGDISLREVAEHFDYHQSKYTNQSNSVF